jgi:hypothetical protein
MGGLSPFIQAKLDELTRPSAAQNVFIGIEHLTLEELDRIRAKCDAKAKAEIVVGQVEATANRKTAKTLRPSLEWFFLRQCKHLSGKGNSAKPPAQSACCRRGFYRAILGPKCVSGCRLSAVLRSF